MTKKLSYVDTHDTDGVKFGLENIFELLESLGNPHNRLKVIHIAGTNGKGSVGAYLLCILTMAGYKVGRLSSPAVFNEFEFASFSCKENGVETEKYITKEFLDSKLDYIKQCKLVGKPSGFEIQVAISMLYFYENKCDLVIVESGMGGRLDATNVFNNTLCDILTSISMDHINMLGNNIEDIARNKCGIITFGGDVVTTSYNKEVMGIIKDECSVQKATIHMANHNMVDGIKLKKYSNTFSYKDIEYCLTQNGMYQIDNAIIAIEAIDVLKQKGYHISYANIYDGLKKSYIRGRFDIIEEPHEIVIDGAHNVNGTESLLSSLNVYYSNKKRVYILSIFKDKEYDKMLELICDDAEKIVLFDRNNSRSLESEEIKKQLCKLGMLSEDVSICKDIEEALIEAKNICYNKQCSLIVCAGSLSFMKELYERLI